MSLHYFRYVNEGFFVFGIHFSLQFAFLYLVYIFLFSFDIVNLIEIVHSFKSTHTLVVHVPAKLNCRAYSWIVIDLLLFIKHIVPHK